MVFYIDYMVDSQLIITLLLSLNKSVSMWPSHGWSWLGFGPYFVVGLVESPWGLVEVSLGFDRIIDLDIELRRVLV